MKHLKVWSIILFILCAGLLAVLFLCIFKNPQFGAFVVNVYEDITSDLGHTVEGMYTILTFWAVIIFTVCFIIEHILILSYINCIKSSNENEEEKVSNDSKTKNVTKTVVLAAQPTQTVEATKKQAKKKSRNTAIDNVEKTLNDVNNVAVNSVNSISNTNQALATFLDSFRK